MLFFKKLSLCAEAYLEFVKQIRGWFYGDFTARLKILTRLNELKKLILYEVFYPGLKLFHPGLNILGFSQ